jgi:hypothetical protein
MSPTTVNLPRLKRAADGHIMYEPGAHSLCPYHQYCAYDGTERERCEFCHGLYDDDGICPCGELPPGRKSPCQCVRCLELFTSLTAFDKHMSNGRCRNPGKRGLVLVDQGGWDIWANPGTMPSREE